jgi:5-methylcytosine-specific restriction endonuclease McrA
MGNPRRANGHRRTQLRRRVLAHYDTCAICGGPVDKTLPPNDPGAPEVDEIIPVSLGGDPLAWNNVRLAHRLCNVKRGNRPDTGTPASPTGDPPAKPSTSRRW